MPLAEAKVNVAFDDYQAEANARLIAEAPAMLELLIRITKASDFLCIARTAQKILNRIEATQ
jgi:hypothetical protein